MSTHLTHHLLGGAQASGCLFTYQTTLGGLTRVKKRIYNKIKEKEEEKEQKKSGTREQREAEQGQEDPCLAGQQIKPSLDASLRLGRRVAKKGKVGRGALASRKAVQVFVASWRNSLWKEMGTYLCPFPYLKGGGAEVSAKIRQLDSVGKGHGACSRLEGMGVWV